ncbi:S8 family serine peptidase [Acinetobacter sp. YH12239]|uniref:S8 family peptidase n=1 Tax=Acinetobacter sp. YH12239 TaxID=2601166 RepID=UPI0015D461D3|nr:S8 family serine peptidase [Acinetobacter sp. YH12239]
MFKTLSLSACLSVLMVGTAMAQMSPVAANAKLNNQAKQKVSKGGINLSALLNNSSNDLIVEYHIDTNHLEINRAQLREHLAQKKQSIQSKFKRLGGIQLLRDYNALPFSFHRVQKRDTLVSLLNDPNVKAVYPNNISYTTASESLPLIGQVPAAAQGYTGAGTTIAILDTGINYRHSDFGNCTAPGVPSSTCKVSDTIEIAREDYQLDVNGHGTNVAAIASKVAPGAKIVMLDVFTGSTTRNGGGASDYDMIGALNWVVNHAQSKNIKSVNLSIGDGRSYSSTCTSSALAESFEKLRSYGVLPVVASGNNKHTGGISYPACTAGAVSVGAVYDSNVGYTSYPWPTNCVDSSTYSDKVTCFSNSSRNLTLLAPGAKITAGGYTLSGTSMAAPHVAGAVAVLRANNAFPSESLDQVVARMTSTGTLVTDQRNSVRTPRLNLLAALNGAPTTPAPAPQPPVVENPIVTPVPTPTPTPAPQRNCRTFLFVTICSG